MRVIVFFDLPVQTSQERKQYRDFRNYLIKNGFLMMQESVYTKLTLNQTVAKTVMDNVRKNRPVSGLVQLLCVTEKQFSKMETLVGNKKSDVIDSDERIIIL